MSEPQSQSNHETETETKYEDFVRVDEINIDNFGKLLRHRYRTPEEFLAKAKELGLRPRQD